jgi:hypothetical protein
MADTMLDLVDKAAHLIQQAEGVVDRFGTPPPWHYSCYLPLKKSPPVPWREEIFFVLTPANCLANPSRIFPRPGVFEIPLLIYGSSSI